jgi:hypothetical protein
VASEEVVAFCGTAPSNDYVLQGLGARPIGQVLDGSPGDGRFRFEMSKLTDYSYAWDDFVGKHGITHLVLGSEFPLRDLREVRWTARRI